MIAERTTHLTVGNADALRLLLPVLGHAVQLRSLVTRISLTVSVLCDEDAHPPQQTCRTSVCRTQGTTAKQQ